MRFHCAVVVSLLSAGPLLAQQAPSGRLEGIVAEKLPSRSVSAASISLVRLDAEPSLTFNARPDAQGRYRIDSVPAGRYLLQLTSPMLDSLELALPSSEVRVAGGQTARANFSLPFGAALRDAVCPGLTLGKGKAVVAGRAIDADTEQPISGADVVVSWTEVAVDAATLKAMSQEQAATVKTGPRGDYRLCGVPSGTWLSVQLQHAARASTAVRVSVSDDEGAVVRDLSMSKQSAPTIASLDSAERIAAAAGRDAMSEDAGLTGTASLTGMVRGASGQPLADAEVRVRDARSSAVTDATGRFSLTNLPEGTQVMLVRQLGYALTEIPVELRAGTRATRDVQLTRAISLDSIRVVALRTLYPEFEFNRRAYFFGKFLTFDDIERRKASAVADLFVGLGGFSVTGQGPTATVTSSLAGVVKGCSGVSLLLNGEKTGVQINDIPVRQVVGIEAYRDAAFAPSRFAVKPGCGLIVVWTKTAARPTRTPKADHQ